MHPLVAMRQISVWLDDLAPERGAFAHAVEWASCLGLPLHAVTSSLGGVCAGSSRSPGKHPTPSGEPASCAVSAEKLEACAEVCARKGVSWDACVLDGPLNLEVEHFLRPVELCVFGDVLLRPLKEELLRRSLWSPQTSVLVCPRTWRPFARALVLNQHGESGNNFLESVIQLCLAFRITPVVLTVARSEGKARWHQQFAEKTFAEHGLPAYFDFVVGYNIRTAVASVACWRRCSHVFVERGNASTWWRWLRGDTMERLLGLSDSLTFLVLPSGRPAVPSSEDAYANQTVGQVTGPR
jgi:hypothetical protein